MDYFDRLLMALTGPRELHYGAGIVVSVLLTLGCIGIIVYGFKSGYIEWALVGAVSALIFSITTTVLIILNVRRNSNRW
jgi:hypothetical protein